MSMLAEAAQLALPGFELRQGDFIQTHTGKHFWPIDPRPEEVDIVDIAQALSNQCRWTGHCKVFYCPTEAQRVLTADLKWKPAGDLHLGEELVAFDEDATEKGSAGNKQRRFRHGLVTHLERVLRSLVRLEMSDGSTVLASEEHPWLVATKASGNQTWRTSAQIRDDLQLGRKRYIHRFATPWEEMTSHKAGWLAGICDGEGYISASNRTGIQAGISQNPGLVLSEAKATLQDYGFSVSECKTGKYDVITLQLRGGWRELMRLLGSVRPIRLVDKFTNLLRAGKFNKQLQSLGKPLQIVRAYNEAQQWVVGIETDRHTYLCEGYAAHNSVAQHCCAVAGIMPPGKELLGLLHDASEAYLVDLARPIKHHSAFGREFSKIEAGLHKAVALRYGLPLGFDKDPDVKRADDIMLVNEARQLLQVPPDWTGKYQVEEHHALFPKNPVEAKAEFLRMFQIYTKAYRPQ